MKRVKKVLAMLLICALLIPNVPAYATEGGKVEVKQEAVSEKNVQNSLEEESDRFEGQEETLEEESEKPEGQEGTLEEGSDQSKEQRETLEEGSEKPEGQGNTLEEGSDRFEGQEETLEEGSKKSEGQEDTLENESNLEGNGDKEAVQEESGANDNTKNVSDNSLEQQNENKKEERGPILFSIRPIPRDYISVDLTGLTPVELTMVSFDKIFTGDKVLKDTDKVMWRISSSDYVSEYTISDAKDRINLSNDYYSSYEMIAGEADQLSNSNTRYTVNINKTGPNNWLIPTVYKEDTGGNRTSVTVSNSWYYYGSSPSQYIDIPSQEMNGLREAYISLGINKDQFPNTSYSSIKVFEGQFSTVEEAEKGKDITTQIMASDMTLKGSGYLLKAYNSQWITMVMYDTQGTVIGCLPFKLYLQLTVSSGSSGSSYISISSSDLYYGSTSYENRVARTYQETTTDGISNYILELYSEYEANGQYLLEIDYYKYDETGGYNTRSDESVTAAYEGSFSSMAEATGKTDIKKELFTDGYKTDYSKGVTFTVFVGEDGSDKQEIYKFSVSTKKGTQAKYTLDSDADVTFTGFYNKDGSSVKAAQVGVKEDSYGAYNYITVLTEKDVVLSELAPLFSTRSSVKLYAPGSSAPLESGKTYFDFSKGAVQFTTASEDGVYSKNYWVQVVNPSDAVNNIYINSFKDEKANTRVENGVIYSNREVIIDSYHNSIHDIIVANMGTTAISNLKVELISDSLILDSYWTLHGNYELAPITQVRTHEKEQENLAKIRLKAKENVSGNITGTLTIKSGETTLVVLNLTGIVGSPVIVTKEIPEAVKYVPYGTFLQNNNSYTWNQINYQLLEGTLPSGMEIKPNGEIYGVPTESGEFTFKVKMDNSDSAFIDDIKTFTLTVQENTDINVENATDTGYKLTERVQNVDGTSTGTQLLESEGEFDTFVDIYLDGKKLVKGTDYEAEAGSTRITIRNQTLQSTTKGTHTLGIEFREGTEKVLKRAAQNFINSNPNSQETEEDSSSGGNSSLGGSSSSAGNTSTSDDTKNGSTTIKNNTTAGNTSTSDDTKNGSTTIKNNTTAGNQNTPIKNPLAVASNSLIEWSTVENLLSQNKANSSVDQETATTNIDVTVEGAFRVAPSVLLNLTGQNRTVAFHGGNGIALSLSGRNINALSRTVLKEMNFNIQSNSNVIPTNLVREKTDTALKQMQLTIEDNVEFPLIVNLHIGVGKEHSGKVAHLYRYDNLNATMVYCGNYTVNKDGQTLFALRRGGVYLLVVTDGLEEVTEIIADKRYIVKPGDTLYRIARRNNISLEYLLRKNPHILTPHLIILGQVINL